MPESEGVIKYTLDYVRSPALSYAGLAHVNAWRKLLHRLALIGQDPRRYGGIGFGNVSLRVPPFDAPPRKRCFLITGTQTGVKPELDPADYALVTEYDPERNRLAANGPVAPSSEALTHGVIYDFDDRARVVWHVHSPDIWGRAEDLRLPATGPQAAYGTPEMTAEVRRLCGLGAARRRILVMGGHEDGVLAYGESAAQAGQVLLRELVRAFQRSLRGRPDR